MVNFFFPLIFRFFTFSSKISRVCVCLPKDLLHYIWMFLPNNFFSFSFQILEYHLYLGAEIEPRQPRQPPEQKLCFVIICRFYPIVFLHFYRKHVMQSCFVKFVHFFEFQLRQYLFMTNHVGETICMIIYYFSLLVFFRIIICTCRSIFELVGMTTMTT